MNCPAGQADRFSGASGQGSAVLSGRAGERAVLPGERAVPAGETTPELNAFKDRVKVYSSWRCRLGASVSVRSGDLTVGTSGLRWRRGVLRGVGAALMVLSACAGPAQYYAGTGVHDATVAEAAGT